MLLKVEFKTQPSQPCQLFLLQWVHETLKGMPMTPLNAPRGRWKTRLSNSFNVTISTRISHKDGTPVTSCNSGWSLPRCMFLLVPSQQYQPNHAILARDMPKEATNLLPNRNAKLEFFRNSFLRRKVCFLRRTRPKPLPLEDSVSPTRTLISFHLLLGCQRGGNIFLDHGPWLGIWRPQKRQLFSILFDLTNSRRFRQSWNLDERLSNCFLRLA